MNSTFHFYPFISQQFRHKHSTNRGKLYLDINKDLRYLEDESTKWLTSKNIINQEYITNDILSRVFNIKLNILKWLHKQQLSLDDVYNSFEKMIYEEDRFEDETLSNLRENLQFAYKTSLKIYHGVSSQVLKSEYANRLLDELPEDHIHYEQFKLTLLLQDSPQLTNFVHYLENSLKLEFAIIAAFKIFQDYKHYDSSVVDELSWIIVDKTQEVGAGAMELDIIKTKSNSTYGDDEASYGEVDKKQLEREQALAETGIEYWAENLNKWE